MRQGGEAGQYTIIAVVVPPAQMGGTQTLFRGRDQSSDETALVCYLVPNAMPEGQVIHRHRWPAAAAGGEGPALQVDFTKPRLVKIERSSSAGYRLDVNAESESSTGDVATNLPSTVIFHWSLGGEGLPTPGLALTGDVAELIVLTSELGAVEEIALLDGLRAKWGL
jgi:hypothetical protein